MTKEKNILNSGTAGAGTSKEEEEVDGASESFPDDLFNPDKLRLSQDFTSMAGVKKLILTIPVRKPNRQDFVRVHPEPEYRLETGVLELKEERETYLVDPGIRDVLWSELIPVVLFATINRQGVLTLWPVRLPGADGRHNPWHLSALDAAEKAKTRWIRIAANMSLGAYDVFEAAVDLPEPEWPNLTFREILEIAFRDRYISSFDHPVVKRLKGLT